MAVLLTGDQATAEDVVQDAFLGLQRAWPRLQDQDKALSYLRTSVVNGCRSVPRGRRRVLLRRVEEPPPVWSAEAAVMAEHDRREMLAAVARLPVRSREILALRYIGAVATANGRNYLVSTYRNPCRSWVYEFQLNDQGQPGAVTAFAALPTIGSQLSDLTVSGNGQMVGFTTNACMGAKRQPNYVGVVNLRTQHTTRWTWSAGSSLGSLSLTADGGLLCYSFADGPSVVRVIPTSAAPGDVAARSRTVAKAAPSGDSELISSATITPDGNAVYFTTFTEGTQGPLAGQVRVQDLATGRSRVVYAPTGLPGLITTDLSVRHMLLQFQVGQAPVKLAVLDLATGRLRYLPSAWLGSMGAIITW